MESFEPLKSKADAGRNRALARGGIVVLGTLLGIGIGYGLHDPDTSFGMLVIGFFAAAALVVSSSLTKRY